MDRKEGDLRTLKERLGNKDKRKLEQACKEGGLITVLPSFKDGSDISREKFRGALKWHLDIPLQNPPEMGCLQRPVYGG